MLHLWLESKYGPAMLDNLFSYLQVMLFFSGLIFFVTLFVTLEVAIGISKMTNLKNIPMSLAGDTPKISVIVPACNEEKTVAKALESLLDQEYENFEIIVVNDRSTDNTNEVLDGLQKRYPQLRIITITDLPPGWLGKSNALRQGASYACGEYLLFTDADIIMERSTFSRAVSAMIDSRLDHLSLVFKNTAQGGLLNAMMLEAGGGLFSLFKPWRVKDVKSRFFIGVGAFNMVKAQVYHVLGGHESIRMHPIDDIMLGKMIKKSGYYQDCYLAYDFVTVPWYESPGAMVNGLMKNLFALFNFRILPALFSVLLVIVVSIFPLWGVFLYDGAVQGFFIAIVLCRLTSLVFGAWKMGYSVHSIPWLFVAPYLSVYMIVKAILLTLFNDGIDWRGTHYPLSLLRKNPPLLW